MMVMGFVTVLMLALLARMRFLWRVTDIVVRSYSVVARHRVSDTWVPPERTALDGRRYLNRKNWMYWCPSGQRLRRRLRRWGPGGTYVLEVPRLA